MPDYKKMIDECLIDLPDSDLLEVLALCLTKHEPSTTDNGGMFRGQIEVFGQRYKNINTVCKAFELRPSFIYTKSKGKSNRQIEIYLEDYISKKEKKNLDDSEDNAPENDDNAPENDDNATDRPPRRRLLKTVDGNIVAN